MACRKKIFCKLKKKLKRKKITKRKNDVFKMTKEDIFPKNFDVTIFPGLHYQSTCLNAETLYLFSL